jgi:hypothetical protein
MLLVLSIMKKLLVLGIIIVALLAGVGTVSAISNGDFESPGLDPGTGWSSFPDGFPGLGWTVEQGLGAPAEITPTLEIQRQAAIGLAPYSGTYFAELDSNANANISQIVSTTNGYTYQISFFQACRNDDSHLPSLLGVYWGSTKLGQTSCDQPMTWVHYSYSPKATSTGSVKLMFVDEGISDSYGVLLDDITVTEDGNNVPAPEFPTLALPLAMLIGIIGVVYVIKGREK